MKKVFMVVMVIMVVLVVTAMSLAEETCYGNYLDYTWCCDDDIKNAVEKGTYLYSNNYYYNGTRYMLYSGLDATGYLGYIPSSMSELEELLEQNYEELGVMFPEVDIYRVGNDGNNDIYRIEIKTMTNLNQKFENEKLGDGFIGENMDYNWLIVLGVIY